MVPFSFVVYVVFIVCLFVCFKLHSKVVLESLLSSPTDSNLTTALCSFSVYYAVRKYWYLRRVPLHNDYHSLILRSPTTSSLDLSSNGSGSKVTPASVQRGLRSGHSESNVWARLSGTSHDASSDTRCVGVHACMCVCKGDTV